MIFRRKQETSLQVPSAMLANKSQWMMRFTRRSCLNTAIMKSMKKSSDEENDDCEQQKTVLHSKAAHMLEKCTISGLRSNRK